MSSQVDSQDEERELRSFGYEQQLSRSMGVFSSLSISISCMCITAGIFTVYAYAPSTAGPAFAVPITHLLQDALGSGGALVFEWVAMVALFAGGLANMAAASRLAFSLSRDRMLPGSRRLAQVSPATSSPIG